MVVRNVARPFNVVELFCGSAVVTKAFVRAGHFCFSVDVRRRKGVCMPDLQCDVMDLRRDMIPFRRVDVVWASPPCDVWSYASRNLHWSKDGVPKSEKCRAHIGLLMKCLALIDGMSPQYFFIENPRGRLRKFVPFMRWLEGRRGVVKELLYGDYGSGVLKPTNIFTNAVSIEFRRMSGYGRGAKNREGAVFSNLTKHQRGKVPWGLAADVVRFCEGGGSSLQTPLGRFYG